MEDVKEFFEQNEIQLTNSSCESDSDSESPSTRNFRNNEEYLSVVKNSIGIKWCDPSISKKRNGEKRLPTRRPDPNVYNRNALLARENRRKKKVYLKTIEEELKVAREANITLVKALKRQLKIAQRLEKEIRYFKNLVNESDKSSSNEKKDIDYKKTNDGTKIFSSSNSLLDVDIQPKEFDSPSECSVNFPLEDCMHNYLPFDFSTFPNFFTDYNVENQTSTNLPTIPTDNDAPNLMDGKKSNYIDVEGDCSFIGEFCLNSNCGTVRPTLPVQLLSD